jgi:hypothetical protein
MSYELREKVASYKPKCIIRSWWFEVRGCLLVTICISFVQLYHFVLVVQKKLAACSSWLEAFSSLRPPKSVIRQQYFLSSLLSLQLYAHNHLSMLSLKLVGLLLIPVLVMAGYSSSGPEKKKEAIKVEQKMIGNPLLLN